VVLVHVLADLESLCVILASGEIYLLPLMDLEMGSMELELPESFGTMDAGITGAAWSPEEEVLIVTTGAEKLLLLTQDFQVLLETDLFSQKQGKDVQVNVGWGSKKTQFHGRAGKSAALAQAPTEAPPSDQTSGDSQASDVCITWRGDGKLFAVTAFDPIASRRTLRIYTREGVYQCSGELAEWTEGLAAWRWPLTSLIAVPCLSSPSEPRPCIVFYERNGLQHGKILLEQEAPVTKSTAPKDVSILRSRLQVTQLSFNPKSDILAVGLKTGDNHRLQLWTCSNYHWFCKLDIALSASISSLEDLIWEQEHPMRLHLFGLSTHQVFELTWDYAVNTDGVHGTAAVAAVIDGGNLNLTPLRYANVPPPMFTSSIQGTNKGAFLTVAFGIGLDGFAAVQTASDETASLFTFSFHVVLAPLHSIPLSPTHFLSLKPNGVSYSCATIVCVAMTDDGKVEGMNCTPYPTFFPEPCPYMVAISDPTSDEVVLLGLTARGRLYFGDRLVSSVVTSFSLHDDCVLLSTSNHQVLFLRKSSLFDASSHSFTLQEHPLARRMERGGRVVCGIPQETGVVLQMPRGNLETIHPHFLVLAHVSRSLDTHDYQEAFLACRKHRVDLNVLYDHAPADFLKHIADFVQQVDRPDYLDLFTSALSMLTQKPNMDVKTDGKMNQICGALRKALLDKDPSRYLNSILVTHVREDPPDLEAALRRVNALKEGDKQAFEVALDFLHFLVQTDRLYEASLGIYDLPLALSVLQRSHQDPREYLPILQELRGMDPLLRQARIDDQLGRREKSLSHLYAAGPSQAETWLKYAIKYSLYVAAITMSSEVSLSSQEDDRRRSILVAYGQFLNEEKAFQKAGHVFSLAEEWSLAARAYVRSKGWREGMTLARIHNFSSETIRDLVMLGYEAQKADRRPLDAATLLMEYLEDVEEAVDCLLEGYEYGEARRIAVEHGRSDLVESTVMERLEEHEEHLGEELEGMRKQCATQADRLDELTQQLVEAASSEAAGPGNDGHLDNVEIQSEVSTLMTDFTRYTKSSSIPASLMSKGSRSTKRQERKKNRGKKGTIYEKDYLIDSLGRLPSRVITSADEVVNVLHHLI
ncbi:IKI3 family-domain-containing protein, partial [Piptocephalis cylindrospora]